MRSKGVGRGAAKGEEEHGVANSVAEWCGSHSSRWDGSNCYEKGLFARVLPAFCDSVADIKLVVRDATEGAGNDGGMRRRRQQWIWLGKMENNVENQR